MSDERAIVPREWRGHVIQFRNRDGYANATAMCQAFGKLWADYRRLKSTEEYLQALAADMGIPISELAEVRLGGVPDEQGTWVHPDLAVHLAQWCSAEFAIRVARWVRELLTTGRVELQPQPLRPYTRRVCEAWRMTPFVPAGYWTVFQHCAGFLVLAETAYAAAGLEMDLLDLLDGSIGTRWKDYREGKRWAGERVRYVHRFPDDDPRGQQPAWAYPMAELQYFHPWLEGEYSRRHFAGYLRSKYGRPALERALPAMRSRGIRLCLEGLSG